MKSPIRIPNWAKFQHYKRRRPPWIRLYRDLLEKPQWHALTGDAAKLLVELWLKASDEGHDKEGVISTPTADLAWQLRKPVEQLVPLLLELERQGFLDLSVTDASTVLAARQQVATPEGEGEGEYQRTSKATAAESFQHRETEHTVGSLAIDAHRVLGLGLWGGELSAKFNETKGVIRKHWVASGIDLAEVHAAIHGLRLMIERGDVEWLADRKGKPLDGLHVLANARAVVPGRDGGQLRSLFDAAVEAYYREGTEQRGARRRTEPTRLLIPEVLTRLQA